MSASTNMPGFAESIMSDNMLFSLTAQIAKDLPWDGREVAKLTYKELRKVIADQREFERRFKPKKRGADDHMGITSLARHDGSSPFAHPGDSAASSPAAGAAPTTTTQHFPLTPDSAQRQQGASNDFDSLGKGKGKGKGNLACLGCLGTGHPQALCPSRPGLDWKCINCKGTGHYANECTSPGGGAAGKAGSPNGGWNGKGGWDKGGGNAKGNGKGQTKGFGKGYGRKGKSKGMYGLESPWGGIDGGNGGGLEGPHAWLASLQNPTMTGRRQVGMTGEVIGVVMKETTADIRTNCRC